MYSIGGWTGEGDNVFIAHSIGEIRHFLAKRKYSVPEKSIQKFVSSVQCPVGQGSPLMPKIFHRYAQFGIQL